MTIRFFISRLDGFGEYRDYKNVGRLVELKESYFILVGEEKEYLIEKSILTGLPQIVE